MKQMNTIMRKRILRCIYAPAFLINQAARYTGGAASSESPICRSTGSTGAGVPRTDDYNIRIVGADYLIR